MEPKKRRHCEGRRPVAIPKVFLPAEAVHTSLWEIATSGFRPPRNDAEIFRDMNLSLCGGQELLQVGDVLLQLLAGGLLVGEIFHTEPAVVADLDQSLDHGG